MNAGHELAIERIFDLPVGAVWRAFTGHLAEWWCPRPWTTEVIAIDWRAGGRFATAMRGPQGEGGPGEGVLLAVEPERRVVFTNLLDADWNPLAPQPIGIVGTFVFTDLGDDRTRYRASARHASEADRQTHLAMGFEQGWGVVADQLQEVARRFA